MTHAHLSDVEELVRRALVAMPDYQGDIIVVGGLVPHLYRRLPGVRVPEHPAIATTEADLSGMVAPPTTGSPRRMERGSGHRTRQSWLS